MTLENHLNQLLVQLLDTIPKDPYILKNLIHSIDLTLLEEQATPLSLAQLKQNGNENHVAALCTYIDHVAELMPHNNVPIATVINFPRGTEPLSTSLIAIEKAMFLGVTEIDYVLPYSMYLEGQTQQALNQCQAVAFLCKENRLLLKIIIETGLFPNVESIYTVSQALCELDCDFIKTSTGKTPVGASLSSVFAILSAIKETHASCGIKVSGGIKKPQQAIQYAQLAELIMSKTINKSWFRIGASSLLNELLKTH